MTSTPFRLVPAPRTARFGTAALLAAVLAAPALAQTDAPAPVVELPPQTVVVESASTSANGLDGHDYGHVFKIFANAVTPARNHMNTTVKQFDVTMQQTQAMIDRGDNKAAVHHALAAIEQMMVLRDQVVTPLLDGREQMAKAMEPILMELAKNATRSDAPQGEGIDALPEHTRKQLRRLSERHRDATTDAQRRNLERNFRLLYRSAKIQARIRAVAPKVQAAQQKVLDRLRTMLGAMDELASATAYAFDTLSDHREIFESYRSILNATENLQEAERLLREVFGGAGSLGEAIQHIDTGLEDVTLVIDQEIDVFLGEFDDDTLGVTTIGLPQDQTTADLMNDFLND